MSQKRKPHLRGLSSQDTSKKKRRDKSGKNKQAPLLMQRVMIMGPTGKTHMEWRPW